MRYGFCRPVRQDSRTRAYKDVFTAFGKNRIAFGCKRLNLLLRSCDRFAAQDDEKEITQDDEERILHNGRPMRLKKADGRALLAIDYVAHNRGKTAPRAAKMLGCGSFVVNG